MTTPDLTTTLTIDVWADIACPWCWIGERRLQAAVARLRAARPEVRVARAWRPYQLQPQLPPEGVAWERFAREKFGGGERMEQMFAHVAAAGAADGLRYRFDRMTVAPNTSDAHRLVLWAATVEPRPGTRAAESRASDDDPGGAGALAMAEALFAAYFAEGRNVSDRAVLADVAVSAGLDGASARATLESDAFVADVRGAQREAQRLGVRGVPFIVLDERLAISGAQPAELFDRALAAALDGTNE
jgi:predicted DsbA family dithiol-disulfide isomerase